MRGSAGRGFLFALLAGVIFQCLNVTVKLLTHELPPMQVAWLRWITKRSGYCAWTAGVV